jgi:hypothetical protein
MALPVQGGLYVAPATIAVIPAIIGKMGKSTAGTRINPAI